jgi:hypothetical protein
MSRSHRGASACLDADLDADLGAIAAPLEDLFVGMDLTD